MIALKKRRVSARSSSCVNSNTVRFRISSSVYPSVLWNAGFMLRTPAVEIARCNADRRRLKDGPPALIARAQRRFGLHASGDVDVNRLQEGSGGLDCRHQRCRDVQPNQAAVLFQVLLFDVTLC